MIHLLFAVLHVVLREMVAGFIAIFMSLDMLNPYFNVFIDEQTERESKAVFEAHLTLTRAAGSRARALELRFEDSVRRWAVIA